MHCTTSLFAKKLEREIPHYFQDLKKAASPNLLLKRAPTLAELREGVRQIVNNANVVPAGGVEPAVNPMPMPRPPKQ